MHRRFLFTCTIFSLAQVLDRNIMMWFYYWSSPKVMLGLNYHYNSIKRWTLKNPRLWTNATITEVDLLAPGWTHHLFSVIFFGGRGSSMWLSALLWYSKGALARGQRFDFDFPASRAVRWQISLYYKSLRLWDPPITSAPLLSLYVPHLWCK